MSKYLLQTENLEKAKQLINTVACGMAGTTQLCQAMMLLIDQIEADTCNHIENWKAGGSPESQRNFKYSTSWPDSEDVEKMVDHLKKQGFKHFKIQASMEEFEDRPKAMNS